MNQVSVKRAEPELVFQHAIEGLFLMGLKGRVTDDVKRQLRTAGLDLDKPLAASCSRAQWNRYVQIAVAGIWAGEPDAVAYHAMGRRLALGYTETLVGRAVAGVLRLIGPRRTLERMDRSFRSGNNYTVCRLTQRSPTEASFWINETTLHPAMTTGLLEAGLELSGAKGSKIDIEGQDAEGCAYRVTWQA